MRAMQLDDVHAFFRTYYHPANASLALAGDIDTERAFELAERYFGDIPAGVSPCAGRAPPRRSTRERRLVLEDRVELPRLYLAWHSPAMFAAGDAELDLAADLLANGKTSRLYQHARLRAAHRRSTCRPTRARASWRACSSSPRPPRRARRSADIAAVIDAEIARLAADGPTDAEMERGRAQAEAQFIYRLQTVGGFGGKSDQLNAYNVLRGDPGFFAQDLDRYRRRRRRACARRPPRICVRPRASC